MEIVSPSTGHRDVSDKKRLYERHGLRAYWTIDLGFKTMEMCRNSEEGNRVGGLRCGEWIRDLRSSE